MKDWTKLGFCPKCGKKKLYQHKCWTDGSAAEKPYCRCFACEQSYYLSFGAPYYDRILEERRAS